MSPKQVRQSESKRQVQREERLKRERQKRLRLFLSIGLSVILLSVGIFAINQLAGRSSGKVAEGEILTVTPKDRPQAQGNSMGDPNAPVKIIEYSDFQCPFCKQFSETTEQGIIDNFVATGKVYFTFRSMGNFVSRNIGLGGTESRDAAEAVYCASDQGKFWEYKDILYANSLGEDEGYFARVRLEKMAEAIGLDVTQFNDCLDSQKYRDRVEQDGMDGQAAGVTGTPSFLINGKLIVGAQPYATFQKEIESALAESGN
jgi:protein-disulfide isomerase